MTKEEKARFDAALQQELQKQLAAFQQQYAKSMLQSSHQSIQALEEARLALEQEQLALDAQKEKLDLLSDRIATDAEGVFQQMLAEKQQAFEAAAQKALLEQLARKHLQAGRKKAEIRQWLDIPAEFLDKLHREEKHLLKTNPKSGPERLRYSDEGRGGTIWYESPNATFDMWWEFAGGNALVILEIPTEAQWEARTKLPLKTRQKVLKFIGEQVVKDKIPNQGHFKIGSDVITFYSGK